MPRIDPFEDQTSDTVFRDVILLALVGFVLFVVLLLPHITPPTKAAEEILAPPGNVIVEMRWPDELAVDVDLWVEAPGDRPVGYSNKGGLVFDLLRDDLGTAGDPMRINYENAFSRGVPAGEYTVNVHLFSNRSAVSPIAVTVVVSVRDANGRATRTIATAEVNLRAVGEEITALRFALDSDGNLVPGSIHDLQRDLRGARR